MVRSMFLGLFGVLGCFSLAFGQYPGYNNTVPQGGYQYAPQVQQGQQYGSWDTYGQDAPTYQAPQTQVQVNTGGGVGFNSGWRPGVQNPYPQIQRVETFNQHRHDHYHHTVPSQPVYQSYAPCQQQQYYYQQPTYYYYPTCRSNSWGW